MKNARIDFLKKVAYSAPVIAGLGTLVEPTSALAKNGKGRSKSKVKRTSKSHKLGSMSRKSGSMSKKIK